MSPKGQVTIPAEIRHMLGVRPKDTVGFRVEGGQVVLRPARSPLDAAYRAIPALDQPLSDHELTTLAAEEHNRAVAAEDQG